MEFKELTVEELSRGYVKDEETGAWTCIFCGKTYEDGLVYQLDGRMVTAERAMKEHVLNIHGGVFYGLTGLDSKIHGLSDSQKDILEGMYLEKDNRELGQEMGISPATVRTHKFNIQRMKREAKILLAVLEQIENEENVTERRHLTAATEAARKSASEAAAEAARDRQKEQDRDRQSEQDAASAQSHDFMKVEQGFSGNSLHPFFTQYHLK